MNDEETTLTAKIRLAQSRARLLAAMGYEEVRSDLGGNPSTIKPTAPGKSSFATKVRHSLLGRWWRRHPLSGMVDLSRPLLQSYAQRHPGKLMAYGAGTGALLWVIKPWRLLSTATIIMLLIKSSDITGLISDVTTSRRDRS